MRKELKDEECILIFSLKQFELSGRSTSIKMLLLSKTLIFCFLTKCQYPKPEFYLNRKTDTSHTFIRTHYSQCYFVNKHLNNALYNKADSLIGKPCLAIITSNAIFLLSSRDENRIVCRMNELEDPALLNVPQPVEISWADPDVPDRTTDVSFEFKRDTIITNILPNMTIIR